MPVTTNERTCDTCAHFNKVTVDPRDPMRGTVRICILDRNYPGARYANPNGTCRLAVDQWRARK